MSRWVISLGGGAVSTNVRSDLLVALGEVADAVALSLNHFNVCDFTATTNWVPRYCSLSTIAQISLRSRICRGSVIFGSAARRYWHGGCLFGLRGIFQIGMRCAAFSSLATRAAYWLSYHLPTLLYSATTSP